MLQIRVMKGHPSPRSKLAVFIESLSGPEYTLAEPIIMKTYTAEDAYKPIGPTLEIAEPAAQKLMDDLWDCGLRPSEGSGSAGQLAAVQNHLEDMRKLLSKVPLIGESK